MTARTIATVAVLGAATAAVLSDHASIAQPVVGLLSDENAAAPSISSLSLIEGPYAGGQAVTLSGTGFLSVEQVTFCGIAATVTASSASSIAATTPAASTYGQCDVVVVTPKGSSTLAQSYHYFGPDAKEAWNANYGVTSSSGSVSAWAGEFGNYTFTQTTSSIRPTLQTSWHNGMNAIKGNAVSPFAYMTTSTIITWNTTTMTVTMVESDTGSSFDTIFTTGLVSGSGTVNANQLEAYSAAGVEVNMYGDAGAQDSLNFGTTGSRGDAGILTANYNRSYDAGTVGASLRYNRAVVSLSNQALNGTLGQPPTAGAAAILGMYGTGAYAPASVGGFVLFDPVATSGELTDAENYYHSYWGI